MLPSENQQDNSHLNSRTARPIPQFLEIRNLAIVVFIGAEVAGKVELQQWRFDCRFC
jgi:hypothetical protein